MDVPISEDERVELWNLEFFVRLGFDGDAVSALLHWRADPHEAERLITRGCSHELALRILRPLEVPYIPLLDQADSYSLV